MLKFPTLQVKQHLCYFSYEFLSINAEGELKSIFFFIVNVRTYPINKTAVSKLLKIVILSKILFIAKKFIRALIIKYIHKVQLIHIHSLDRNLYLLSNLKIAKKRPGKKYIIIL